MSRNSFVLICLGLMAQSTTSFAQEFDEGVVYIADRKRDPDSYVITGTKAIQSMNELAGNTAIVTDDDIDWVNQEHISDLLNRQPGVNIHHNSGQEHLTAIRSPVLTGGAGAGSFLYLEDGIPLRSPGFANVNGLFEAHSEQAERIEITRGPGSALYGSNAVHGLINFFTAEPGYEQAIIDTWFGAHEQSVANIAVSNDNFSLSTTLKHDDGYRADSGYDQQKLTGRYDWKKGDNAVTAVLSGHNLNQETAGFIRGFEAYRDTTIAKTNPNPEAFRDTRAIRGYVAWTHELDRGSITITPFFRANEMEFLMHFLPGQALEENGHWSTGVQARWDVPLQGGHQIIVGVDTDYTDGYLKENQTNPTVFSFVQGLHYDYEVQSIIAAPYIHSEWQVSDALRLTAGLRLDYTNYDYKNNGPTNTVGRFQRIADRSDDFFSVIPKFGLNYQIDNDTNLYASLARGTRAPQTTDLYRLQINQNVGDIDPEELDSLEIGLRGDIDSNIADISYDLAAFYMQKRNFFFRDADGFNVSNGKTEHVGIEALLKADFGDLFDAAASLTYAQHTYAFDNDVSGASTEDIRDGDDVDTAPRFLANLRLGLNPTERTRAELEWAYVSEYYLDGANTTEYDGHNLFHLRAAFDLNDNVQLYGRVNNLMNAPYANRADFAFGSYRYFPGEERNFVFGIKVRTS